MTTAKFHHPIKWVLRENRFSAMNTSAACLSPALTTKPSFCGVLPSAGLALAMLIMLALLARAADGDIDTSFNPDVREAILALSVQPDGKMLLAGWLRTRSSTNRYGVVRLNADGTLDSSFNPLAGYPVRSMAIQQDGKILVGGWLNSTNGPERYGLMRLHADGSLDADFKANARGRCVYDVTVQVDGRVLVGEKGCIGGRNSHAHIIRLNPDGTVDSNFNLIASGSFDCAALQADGKILLGSTFASINGRQACIARLNADGTLDNDFAPNTDGNVSCVAVQADGKILVGGCFNKVGRVERPLIARLNADGTLDPNFNANAVGRDSGSGIKSLVVLADGRILVGSHGTTFGGLARTGIARLNRDGSLDTSFIPKLVFDVYSHARAIAVQPDGRILMAGTFYLKRPGTDPEHFIRLFNTQPSRR